MTRRPKAPQVDLDDLDKRPPSQRARLALEWLSDDEFRHRFYARIRARHGGVLCLPSRATADEDSARDAAGAELDGRIRLVADPELVVAGLTDGATFSNAPYGGLGSGQFLLAMDPEAGDKDRHRAQAAALGQAFCTALRGGALPALARWASRATQTALLGRDEFDGAAFAEHAALRFAQVLFGFATADLPLLTGTLRPAYRAMNVQMFARHFVGEPASVAAGKAAMARLAARADELIREHALGEASGEEGWPEGLERPGADLPALTPVLRALAREPGELDGQGLSVLVVGALAGTVHNIQAAVCIALAHLLARPEALAAAQKAAFSLGDTPDADAQAALWPHIAPALRDNPPAPFLPRRMLRDHGELLPKGADVILCVGAATRALGDHALADSIVFGLDLAPPRRGLHYCLGATLARAMVSRTVADLLCLPGLAEQLDARDGRPIGLDKRWGFAMQRYPLRHRRGLRVHQQPLNVYMRVRMPVAEHAQALREIIQIGAPRIEQMLREARHVHFAWFQFHEGGSVLSLHTVFDGDLAAYLQHFALVVDDVFDKLFEHLEGGPPAPVRDHVDDFVAAVVRHHRPAAEGFFFSAEPKATTPIVHAALARLPLAQAQAAVAPREE